MSYSKKSTRLGMSFSTASSRLKADLLFSMAVKLGHTCYQCGAGLERESFSIDHKYPWLNSDSPVRLFFDLDNIGFSNLSCNSGARASVGNKKYFTDEERIEARRASHRKERTPEKRRVHYLRTGK